MFTKFEKQFMKFEEGEVHKFELKIIEKIENKITIFLKKS